MKKIWISFIFISFILGCDVPQDAAKTPSKTPTTAEVKKNPTKQPPRTSDSPSITTGCKTVAKVKDMTGLDGCKFMLILGDGTKLLPAKTNVPFKYKDGQIVHIDYKKTEGTVTICMAEDMIVEVTCIKELKTGGVMPEPNKGKPAKRKCVDVTGPEGAEWLLLAHQKHQSKEIIKFTYLDGFAYLIKTKEMGYLYDCQGNVLCEGRQNHDNACTQKLKYMSDPVSIWKVD